LGQVVGKGHGYGGASRRDVFKTGRRRQAQGGARLGYQLPGIEGIEHIDQRGCTMENVQRGLAAVDPLGHGVSLVRIATVSQTHKSFLLNQSGFTSAIQSIGLKL
jgi:hypothetical protein